MTEPPDKPRRWRPQISLRMLLVLVALIFAYLAFWVPTTSESKRSQRWGQFSLRALLVFSVLAGLLLAYAGSYYRISRRGVGEVAEYFGVEGGFFYVPVDEVQITKSLSRHYRLSTFYAPANWIDRHLSGGPSPALSVVFEVTE